MKFSRQSLYDAIWVTPRSQLSAKWNIPIKDITKACHDNQIPIPPSGYWTQIALNKAAVKAKLFGDTEVLVEVIPTTRTTKQLPETKQSNTLIKVTPSNPPTTNKIPLTRSIEDALPSVRKAFRSYNAPKAKRDYRYQYVWPGGDGLLRIAVMPEMVERTLLLIDSIVRECKKNKWKVLLPSGDNNKMNAVVIGDVTVHFTITEQRRQEKVKSEDSWHDWDYRYHSLGILRFQYGARYSSREIKDGKKSQLEDRLDDIIQAFRDEVVAVHHAEKARKEREYLDGLKRQVERLVDDAQSANEKCASYLDEKLNQFEKYEKLNKFYNHMRSKVDVENSTLRIKEWLTWVEIKINELDPANDINSFNFDVPINVLTQVEKAIASDNERYSNLKQIDVPATLENILKWKRAYPRY